MPATPTTAANPVFTTTAPQVSAVDVADIARRYYGLDVEVHPLTSERDSNFQITASDGAKFVLKIANAAEPVAVTEFQNRALLHIATVAPTLAVPRVMPALDGRFEFALPVGGSQHVVRMLTYLEGQPFHKTAPSRSSGERSAHASHSCRMLSPPSTIPPRITKFFGTSSTPTGWRI